MLKSEDLNKTFDKYATEVLIPRGFKKSGNHYFKKSESEFYGIIKKTNRGIFDDYFLVYNHISSGNKFEDLKKKPSTMLKDYPISVNVNDLEIIYVCEPDLLKSKYYFYNLSRTFNIDKNCNENKKTWDNYLVSKFKRDEMLRSDKNYLNNYVKTTFNKIENYGINFFEDCNLQLCYRSVKRPFNEKKVFQYKDFYIEFIASIEEYISSKGIVIPQEVTSGNKTWLKKLFG